MAEPDTAARYLPDDPTTLSLKAVERRAKKCRACPLYRLGTQTVFGEGRPRARVVFVAFQADLKKVAKHPAFQNSGRTPSSKAAKPS